MSTNHTPEAELRAKILTEFKQVLKLAPTDYTENCTNVVMSLIASHIATAVREELDELTAWALEHGTYHFEYDEYIKARIAALDNTAEGEGNNGA